MRSAPGQHSLMKCTSNAAPAKVSLSFKLTALSIGLTGMTSTTRRSIPLTDQNNDASSHAPKRTAHLLRNRTRLLVRRGIRPGNAFKLWHAVILSVFRYGALDWAQQELKLEGGIDGKVACVAITSCFGWLLQSRGGLCEGFLRDAAVGAVRLWKEAPKDQDTLVPVVFLNHHGVRVSDESCYSCSRDGDAKTSPITETLNRAVANDRQSFILTDSFQRSVLLVCWRGDRRAMQFFVVDSHRCTSLGLQSPADGEGKSCTWMCV
jgi:hypothetical protein